MTPGPVERTDASGGNAQWQPRQLLDPELAAMQVLMPHIDVADVDAARAIEASLTAELRSVEHNPAVEISDTPIERPDGSTFAIRSYRSGTDGSDSPQPVLLFIHGGSFVTGGLHTEDTRCEFYVVQTGCTVVAVDYRLAPEHPFPAGLDDCHTALNYLREQASELHVDPHRVAVGGLSAGGALASSVASRAAGDEYPELVLQLLLFPVLDAGMRTYSSQHSEDAPVLTSTGLRDMWSLYLGSGWAPGLETYPRYSSPAHTDSDASPPTFICTAGLDPLRDEVIEHAQRLLHAGVPVDLRHYARGFHSFDSFHFTRLGRHALNDQVEALRAAFS